MSRLAVVGASTSVRFQSVARCHTTTLRVLLTVENLHDLIYTILPQFTWLWYLKSSSIFVINKSKDEMKTSGNLHCRHGRSVTKCLVSSPPALEICLCGVSREVMVMLFSGLLLRNLEQVTIIHILLYIHIVLMCILNSFTATQSLGGIFKKGSFPPAFGGIRV